MSMHDSSPGIQPQAAAPAPATHSRFNKNTKACRILRKKYILLIRFLSLVEIRLRSKSKSMLCDYDDSIWLIHAQPKWALELQQYNLSIKFPYIKFKSAPSHGGPKIQRVMHAAAEPGRLSSHPRTPAWVDYQYNRVELQCWSLSDPSIIRFRGLNSTL